MYQQPGSNQKVLPSSRCAENLTWSLPTFSPIIVMVAQEPLIAEKVEEDAWAAGWMQPLCRGWDGKVGIHPQSS